MPNRKVNFYENNVYHVFAKSIAGYKIFDQKNDARRFLNTVLFYNAEKPESKFSLRGERKDDKINPGHSGKILKIIAYCVMPTHFHLIIEPIKPENISHYMNVVLKSYSRYFNVKHNRKGPLWESRFKSVLVETDEQLLHLTRYTHLNPVTAYLVNKPEDWNFSSYKEYLGLTEKICEFEDRLKIQPEQYAKFVNERISYQRELAKIKDLILE
ncbi:MAG: hypothetical protein COT17_05820 [Elusimicrobia bacterium CG08_land_8_20_14_0_20_51_18]|nr:MAG: hypothetical protein COT17_05820 [Elusimicrobia bacterium CG08_land_8_20_14_0_20_51_18]